MLRLAFPYLSIKEASTGTFRAWHLFSQPRFQPKSTRAL